MKALFDFLKNQLDRFKLEEEQQMEILSKIRIVTKYYVKRKKRAGSDIS